MKSAVIMSSFYPPQSVGGAELVAQQHARGLRDMGFSVHVLTGGRHALGEIGQRDNDGVTVHRVGLSSLDPYEGLSNPQAAAYLSAVVRDITPQLGLIHNFAGLGLETVKRLVQATPSAAWLHDYWSTCLRNTTLHGKVSCSSAYECGAMTEGSASGAMKAMLRSSDILRTLQSCVLIYGPSSDICQRASARLPGMTILQRSNGVIERQTAVQVDRGVVRPVSIAFVGYLGDHKGFQTALDIFERLHVMRREGEFTFHVFGDGPMASLAQEFATSHPGDFVYRGRVSHDEVMSGLGDMDILLNTSLWPENEPVSILDAQANGVAVVASNIGGHEALVAEDCGVLFPPGDTASAVSALAFYIDNPHVLSTHGRRAVEISSTRRSAREISDVVESLVGSSPGHPLPGLAIAGEFRDWAPLRPKAAGLLESLMLGRIFNERYAVVEEWRVAHGLIVVDESASWAAVRRAVAMDCPVAVVAGVRPFDEFGFERLETVSDFINIAEGFALDVRRSNSSAFARAMNLERLPDAAFELEEDGSWQ